MVNSGVASFLFIRLIIKTKCKLLQKSLLHYSGSYLPTTPPPSVIFVTKQIPGGGTFYCAIAKYPKLPNSPKFHETADIEAICILQIASTRKRKWLVQYYHSKSLWSHEI